MLTRPPEYLIVIDSLNPLASRYAHLLSSFFAAIVGPTAPVVAVYHDDVPLVLPKTAGEYDPHPLTLLSHLATTVFRVSSLSQAVEVKRAHSRSLQAPERGLREGREGVLIGLRGAARHGPEVDVNGGVVVEMEMRRRSGRAVAEKFILMSPKKSVGGTQLATITLLSDHPLFAPQESTDTGDAQGGAEGEVDSTFSLGLTEKQRKDREGIVLPYFDAQTDIGAGEGGRILYDMGREDDFDDEEDEI